MKLSDMRCGDCPAWEANVSGGGYCKKDKSLLWAERTDPACAHIFLFKAAVLKLDAYNEPQTSTTHLQKYHAPTTKASCLPNDFRGCPCGGRDPSCRCNMW